MNDTSKTVTIGALGFMAQLANIDIILKVAIGLATFLYIVFKSISFAAKNWESIRHPINTARRRKQLADPDKPPTET